MSKVFEGNCENEKVYIEGTEIEEAVILSEGKGSSEGMVLIDKEKIFYLAKTVDDLKTIIDNLVAAYTKIVESMASNSPAPSIPLDLSMETTELNNLKGMLK